MLVQVLLEGYSVRLLKNRRTYGDGRGNGDGFGSGSGNGYGFSSGTGNGFSNGNGNGFGGAFGKYGNENPIRPLIWEVFMNTEDQTTYIIEE